MCVQAKQTSSFVSFKPSNSETYTLFFYLPQYVPTCLMVGAGFGVCSQGVRLPSCSLGALLASPVSSFWCSGSSTGR